MELNNDDFFELLFDNDPHFEDDVEEFYDLSNNLHMISYIRYKEFNKSDDYNSTMLFKCRKVLLQYKTDHALNKINNQYLEGYLDDLKLERDNFIMQSIIDREIFIHKKAYITSQFIDPLRDEKIDLTKSKDGKLINEFEAYNKFRYDIIQFMIAEIEKTIGRSKGFESDFERLELNNSSMADIALLFRLLEENKVFTAKYKTHIFRVIQNSFKGSDKSTFNEGSIKNAFNEPDPNSVKNVEFLLANMKSQLKKI